MTATIDTPAQRATPDADQYHPHDLGAERIVLGAMMLTAEVVGEVCEILTTADYYQPVHARIHAAILGLAADGNPTDPTAVLATMDQAGDLPKLAQVGGPTYLVSLVQAVPVALQGAWYARQVADHATRRRIIAAGMRVVSRAILPGMGIADLVDQAQATIHAATTSHVGGTGNMVELADIVDDVIDDLMSGEPPAGLVSTGLGDLDMVLGGFHPGQLIVIGARPGMGKTVAALDFVRRTAEGAHNNGIPSLIFTLEMSQREIVGRIIAATCEVGLTGITNRRLSPEDRRKIEAKREQLRRTPIIIDDTPNMTVGQIRSTARRAAQRRSVGLIAVDYLQLMTATTNSGQRHQDVAEMSRGLKLLAKELNIPVIACSQLNRSSESRSDRRPQLADLRESGSIEQDADVVLLLHRDDYHDKESGRSGEIDIIVAKNRFGPQETVTCAAQLDKARIVSMGRC